MSNIDPLYVANLEQGLKDVITASYGSPNIQNIAQKALAYQTPEVDTTTVAPDPTEVATPTTDTTDTTTVDAGASTSGGSQS